jgi:hypothetical protein
MRRKTMGRWVVSAVVLAGVVALGSTAQAQGKDPVAAEALFQQGREAAKKGDFATACPKFSESYRLDPTAGTLFNLADCEEHTGKVASAWQHFQQVAQEFPASDERVPYAREHAGQLEKKLPRLTIKLASGAPAGSKVLRDGIEMGQASLGSALPLDPGLHTLVVTAPGRKEMRVEVTLGEGQSEQVTLVAGEPGAGTTTVPANKPGPESKPSGGGSSPTEGYVLLGVGAASLVAGGITGAMVLGKKSTVSDGCDSARYDSPDAANTSVRPRSRPPGLP